MVLFNVKRVKCQNNKLLESQIIANQGTAQRTTALKHLGFHQESSHPIEPIGKLMSHNIRITEKEMEPHSSSYARITLYVLKMIK